MKPRTAMVVPGMGNHEVQEFSSATIGRGESECLFRCPDAGNGKAQGIKDGHPVVFGHVEFPDWRKKPLQLGKAFREETRTSVLRGG